MLPLQILMQINGRQEIIGSIEPAAAEGTMDATSPSSVRTMVVSVWDPVVRFGHWALVVAFAVAYLTAEEESGSPDFLHVWGGYVVGAIVVVRVLWGFVGTKYARFSDFICSPFAALRYLLDLMAGRARRYVGHSPAGGAMVIVLLACLAGTVATGIVAYGERGKGPLAADGPVITAVGHAEENEAGGGEAKGAEGKSIVSEFARCARQHHPGARGPAHIWRRTRQLRASRESYRGDGEREKACG
jgi:cytochrome b